MQLSFICHLSTTIPMPHNLSVILYISRTSSTHNSTSSSTYQEQISLTTLLHLPHITNNFHSQQLHFIFHLSRTTSTPSSSTSSSTYHKQLPHPAAPLHLPPIKNIFHYFYIRCQYCNDPYCASLHYHFKLLY